jgi:hypothetical protein
VVNIWEPAPIQVSRYVSKAVGTIMKTAIHLTTHLLTVIRADPFAAFATFSKPLNGGVNLAIGSFLT